MTTADFVRQLPKVELHTHMLGSMPAWLGQEFVDRAGIELPLPVADLYQRCYSPAPDGDEYRDTAVPMSSETPLSVQRFDRTYPLQELARMLAPAIRTEADFRRLVWAIATDAARRSNVVHIEIAIEPTTFMAHGVPYETIATGSAEGLRQAKDELGISGALLVGIDRGRSGQDAMDLVGEMIATPHDEIVGIGLQASEYNGPPAQFREAYRLAADAGLHRTAHAAEHVPSAQNVATCLDQLQCERIDHGYFILEDDAIVERCREQGVIFTCAATTSRIAWRPWRLRSIERMLEAGLRVTFCADDPPMFGTTLTEEYLRIGAALGLSKHELRQIALTGVDAAWVDEPRKDELRREMEAA